LEKDEELALIARRAYDLLETIHPLSSCDNLPVPLLTGNEAIGLGLVNGGLDIYISKKEKGDWGPARNLGPEINTAFNEDRPSLVNNGKTLFFASQDHDNIGGYDIFRSEMQSNGIWSKPQNLGYPFNTPDDNIFFMPVGNGKSGFVSLYREAEGFGKEDIYKVTFK
jgi:hypothetical protein